MICNPVIAGTKLPDLANPGTAADLAKGKELIGADGQVVTGTLKVIQNLPVAYSAGTLKSSAEDALWGGVAAYNDYANDETVEFVMIYKRAGEAAKYWNIGRINNGSFNDSYFSPDNTVSVFYPRPGLYITKNRGADMRYITFVIGDNI